MLCSGIKCGHKTAGGVGDGLTGRFVLRRLLVTGTKKCLVPGHFPFEAP